ncbi:MAG TPA: aldehyde dehydrogenase family protein [Planctomycetota bacterium]|nr:aldehyde dehydrogenase family protein [Planctomycetota bacterium]
MEPLIDRNPANGEVLATVEAATTQEVHAAIARARIAQPDWAARTADDRRQQVLASLVDFAEIESELANTITREMGKTRRSAIGEVRGYLAGVGETTQEIVRAIEPQRIAGESVDTVVVRVPHGVVAAITPWNFPLGMPLSILLPALVTGNSVVFKPSEHVPLTGELIHRTLARHLPEGVLELVQGAGEVGAELVGGDIDMIGFVGSRDTGMRIMERAAGGLKRLVLELGGKDPMVVFADADLDAAAECAVTHSLRNTGQVCCSVERVYVEANVADAFESKVLQFAKDWQHGDGFDEDVHMGPLVSEAQRERVHAQVLDAVEGGARLLLGGVLPDGPGSYYPATVLADVGQGLRITREETFGPVVALSRFAGGEAEAIALANDTPYGLGANVWTSDLERGQRVAQALHAGQVGINRYLAGAAGTPWVGARQSGFGFLGGPEGHRQFTTPKTIGLAKPVV